MMNSAGPLVDGHEFRLEAHPVAGRSASLKASILASLGGCEHFSTPYVA